MIGRRNFMRRGRYAAVLVEFSMVLPVIAFSFAAMIEISRIMLLQHTADTAAYEGARQGMIPGATSAQAKAAADELLQLVGLRSTTVTVSPESITESTSLITVDVVIPIADNCWITPFLNKEHAVTSSVTLFCERPPIIQLTGVPQMKLKASRVKQTQTDDNDG